MNRRSSLFFSRLSRLLLPVVLGVLLPVMAGCGSDEGDAASDAIQRRTYTDVRGRFLGTATGGRDMVVHHEAIPDLMGPMVMTLPLADTAALRTIEKNDPIAFDLVFEGANLRIENVEALPDTVTLDLEADTAAADTNGG
jgi:Cu/Ag efflux protein CusF